MRRGVATGLAVGMVVINAGAFLYLRDRLSTPPEEPEPSSKATDVPSAEPDDRPFTGPVLLAGAADGAVLRSTHGDCAEAVPATAWVAGPDDAPVEVAVPGLVETLALGSDDRGWFVVGADDACQVRAWSGNASGSSWSRADIPVGVWYLDPSDDTQVISPKGPEAAPAGCTASWIESSGLFAYLLCDNGSAFRADRTERQFESFAASEGLGGVAPREDGRVATLGEDPGGCGAYLRVFDDDGELPDEACLGSAKAALGLAWAGDTLVAQVGYDLMSQVDGDWVTRG